MKDITGAWDMSVDELAETIEERANEKVNLYKEIAVIDVELNLICTIAALKGNGKRGILRRLEGIEESLRPKAQTCERAPDNDPSKI